MKFIHIADCHLGGWREQKLRELNLQAFQKVIEKCIIECVDFLLISGDLFNTSLPPIDILKGVVSGLKQLSDNGIRVYAIAGSHDFSPSGKTMLDVLENAGLLVNVARATYKDKKLQLRLTKDPKTGAVICGLPGRRGMLDSSYYKALDRESLNSESQTKIFLFHTAISEYKPKGYENMKAMPLSSLPRGFDYYAGGHVHSPLLVKPRGWIAMPGPTFPNNFAELEKLECGSMIICKTEGSELSPEIVKLPLIDVVKINLECTGKSPEQVSSELFEAISNGDVANKLLMIRLQGTLGSGKLTDIDFSSAYKKAEGTYFIMRNTSQLHTKEFEGIKVEPGSVDDIERRLIEEHSSELGLFSKDEKVVVAELLSVLSKEKMEGETRASYEDRIMEEFHTQLKNHL